MSAPQVCPQGLGVDRVGEAGWLSRSQSNSHPLLEEGVHRTGEEKPQRLSGSSPGSLFP